MRKFKGMNKSKGWRYEPIRHGLAAKGIKTKISKGIKTNISKGTFSGWMEDPTLMKKYQRHLSQKQKEHKIFITELKKKGKYNEYVRQRKNIKEKREQEQKQRRREYHAYIKREKARLKELRKRKEKSIEAAKKEKEKAILFRKIMKEIK